MKLNLVSLLLVVVIGMLCAVATEAWGGGGLWNGGLGWGRGGWGGRWGSGWGRGWGRGWGGRVGACGGRWAC